MINSIKVTNNIGESVDIKMTSSASSGLVVKSIKGLGPAKSNINTTKIIDSDVSIFNSANMSTRNIVFTFILDKVLIEESRNDVYKFFPIKREVEMIFETDLHTVRIKGYVESNEPDIFNKLETQQVSVLCPDPYFYDIGNGTKTMIFDGTEKVFEFPFSNESLTEKEIIFGEIKHLTNQVIYYEGQEEIGLTIKLHASNYVYDPVFYNIGKRQTVKINTEQVAILTGDTIKPGDDVIINTRKGSKSVTLIRDGVHYNIITALDSLSTWFTLSHGDNTFSYDSEYGAEDVEVTYEFETIYSGI